MGTLDRIQIENIVLASEAGSGQLWADLYRPVSEPVFSLLIVHGMAEHRARYAEFAIWLAQRGGLVLAYDHAGHGQSAVNFESLGYFAERNGDQIVLSDLKLFHQHLRNLLPDKPLVILGHSMGSLIVRDYLSGDHELIDGVILTGTSGPNPALPVGQVLARLIKATLGSRFRSKMLDDILHAGFLKKVEHPKTVFDWLTRDSDIVDQYLEDPYCGYRFTTAALLDLMIWTDRVSQKSWPMSINKNLPILLASGQEDPVGQFGQGVQIVADRLFQAGRFVELKLYPKARHEILNETNHLEVYEDLFIWMNQTVIKYN